MKKHIIYRTLNETIKNVTKTCFALSRKVFNIKVNRSFQNTFVKLHEPFVRYPKLNLIYPSFNLISYTTYQYFNVTIDFLHGIIHQPKDSYKLHSLLNSSLTYT